MNRVSLPALDGRTPLGFLAAVGAVRLLADQCGDAPRLSWSADDATAVLHSTPHRNTEDVARSLATIVADLADGQVIPGAPRDLPPPGEAPDRLRLPRPEFRALVDTLRVSGDPQTVDSWLASLVTDLSVKKGRVSISLFAAPSGKQSMRTMLEKPLGLVRGSPGLLLEALTAWRRVPGYTGEYLDHRVLFDAADAPDGKPRERGVPGATWLALMAYPMFRTTSLDGASPVSSGWSGERGRLVLRWPLWRDPLDTAAIQVLLEHPHVLAAEREAVVGAAARRLDALGIFYIGTAGRRRIEGRDFDGVLAPLGA